MCLEEIEMAIKPDDRFLDVGCGSGVLSIAALALGAGHATGLDIEDDAVISSINQRSSPDRSRTTKFLIEATTWLVQISQLTF
jgi:ribosomal protein L11 methylase PrmA